MVDVLYTLPLDVLVLLRFFLNKKIGFYKLFFLWTLINAAIFILAISFGVPENWAHSRDQEIGIFIIYFPVVELLALLFPETVRNVFATNLVELGKLFGGSSTAEMFIIWIAFSGLAIVEAVGLIALYRLLARSRVLWARIPTFPHK